MLAKKYLFVEEYNRYMFFFINDRNHFFLQKKKRKLVCCFLKSWLIVFLTYFTENKKFKKLKNYSLVDSNEAACREMLSYFLCFFFYFISIVRTSKIVITHCQLTLKSKKTLSKNTKRITRSP